jgi:phage/plasmid-associated DNA primase
MIKKIASGGDSLIGRNHGGKETEFITHVLPVILANDLPKIKTYDDAVESRLRVIGYTKNYVDEPSNEFELKKDDNIKNELNELRFQRMFVGILIQSYFDFMQNGEPEEPVDVLKAKDDWVAQDKSFIDTFLKDYEITDNEYDWVRSSDIEEWFTQKKLGTQNN